MFGLRGQVERTALEFMSQISMSSVNQYIFTKHSSNFGTLLGLLEKQEASVRDAEWMMEGDDGCSGCELAPVGCSRPWW